MLTTEGNANLVKIDDCVEVAAEGHVVADLAEPRDLHGAIESHGERRDIGERDVPRLAALHLHGGDDEPGGCTGERDGGCGGS